METINSIDKVKQEIEIEAEKFDKHFTKLATEIKEILIKEESVNFDSLSKRQQYIVYRYLFLNPLTTEGVTDFEDFTCCEYFFPRLNTRCKIVSRAYHLNEYEAVNKYSLNYKEFLYHLEGVPF